MDGLTWKYISRAQVQALNDSIGYPIHIRELLAEFLLDRPPKAGDRLKALSEQDRILVDLYFYAYTFSKSNEFGAKKTSCFISIMKDLLRHDIFEGMNSVNASFSYFSKSLMRHAMDRPPASEGVFSPDELAKIVKEVTHGYYRLFKLFNTAFTAKKTLVLDQKPLGDACPPPPPRPLRSGVKVGPHRMIDEYQNVLIETEAWYYPHLDTMGDSAKVVERPNPKFFTAYEEVLKRHSEPFYVSRKAIEKAPLLEEVSTPKKGPHPEMVRVIHVALLINGVKEKDFTTKDGVIDWRTMKPFFIPAVQLEFFERLLQYDPLKAKKVRKSARTFRVWRLLNGIHSGQFKEKEMMQFGKVYRFLKTAIDLRYQSMLQRVPKDDYARGNYTRMDFSAMGDDIESDDEPSIGLSAKKSDIEAETTPIEQNAAEEAPPKQ